MLISAISHFVIGFFSARDGKKMFVDCYLVELSSCSEEDILKELEELSLEAQGGKAKVSTTQFNP